MNPAADGETHAHHDLHAGRDQPRLGCAAASPLPDCLPTIPTHQSTVDLRRLNAAADRRAGAMSIPTICITATTSELKGSAKPSPRAGDRLTTAKAPASAFQLLPHPHVERRVQALDGSARKRSPAHGLFKLWHSRRWPWASVRAAPLRRRNASPFPTRPSPPRRDASTRGASGASAGGTSTGRARRTNCRRRLSTGRGRLGHPGMASMVRPRERVLLRRSRRSGHAAAAP